jgi:hypothetical protein
VSPKDDRSHRDEGENGGVHWHRMMLRERWMVAAIVGLGLISTTGGAPGQSSSRKTQTTKSGHAVQPDQGPPPDQAVQTDQSVPLEQGTPDPVTLPDQTAPPDQSAPPDAGKTPEQATQPQGSTQSDQANQEEPVKEKSAKEEPVKEEEAPAKEPVKQEPVAQTAPPQAIPVESVQAALAPPAPGPPASPEQQQLERDTARLVVLVQELKLEVDKAGSNTLSLAALRKADEIQRLSKSLKERVKDWGQVPQNKPQ